MPIRSTKYLPNDAEEMAWLDLGHYLWRATLEGRLRLCPIDPGVQSALDLGNWERLVGNEVQGKGSTYLSFLGLRGNERLKYTVSI